MPLEQPGVLATLAQLRLTQGRAGDALVATGDAVARCEAMGACGMFRGAFVRLSHAEALHATGDTVEARRVIEAARARLVAIAAKFPEADRRQAFFDGVPEHARTVSLAHAWLD